MTIETFWPLACIGNEQMRLWIARKLHAFWTTWTDASAVRVCVLPATLECSMGFWDPEHQPIASTRSAAAPSNAYYRLNGVIGRGEFASGAVNHRHNEAGIINAYRPGFARLSRNRTNNRLPAGSIFSAYLMANIISSVSGSTHNTTKAPSCSRAAR